MFSFRKKLEMPSAAEALPGRPTPIRTAGEHFVLHLPLKGPYPEGLQMAMFGLGCFWGVGTQFLGARRRHLHDRGRLCRRFDAEPDLRRSLLRPHRA